MQRVIYEAVNHTLQEVYIGMSRFGAEEAFSRLKRDPPPSLFHWDFEQHFISANQVALFEGTDADGIRFFSDFCASSRRPGTQIIRCELDCEPEPRHDLTEKIIPCEMDCASLRKDRPR